MVNSFESCGQTGLAQTDAHLFPRDLLAVYQYQKVLRPKALATLETGLAVLARTTPYCCVLIYSCQVLGSAVLRGFD